MKAYYNEIDDYCCGWLSNLMDAGCITPGKIDDRSIVHLRPDDFARYERVHFFAGLAGWDYALSLSGYSGHVWTGSCPCQPFSAAGKGKAADDERHLWPAWFSLIRECKPARVFGEQVEAAIGWGWLDAVFSDLETEGYACGAAILPACSVGAPHIRQRVWFVADTRHNVGTAWATGGIKQPEKPERERLGSNMPNGGVADSECGAAERQRYDLARQANSVATEVGQQRIRNDVRDGKSVGGMADADIARCGAGRATEAGNGGDTAWVEPSGFRADGMGYANGAGCEVGERQGPDGAAWQARRSIEQPSGSPWADLQWLPCTDGKARPVEPGTFPLAHGIPARVGRLRAYGNAIVPQVAAEFIRAVCT
jgi:DNA (cytosine-5)-methyltransferase 1